MRKKLLFFLFLGCSLYANAQSLSDGIFMDKRYLCAGVLYNHDAWDHYWEGSLLRTNGNIGTLTTQNAVVMANYGVFNRLNVIAMLPFVWTNASSGTLTGQRGFQDFTLGIKYKAFETNVLGGKLSGQVVAGGSIPSTNYVADYLPLSIGLHSKTLWGRGILHFAGAKHLTFLLSAAYIGRSNVSIDRTSYYTTHQIYSSEVAMPDAAQFAFRGGYYSFRWGAEFLAQHDATLGGFDIRRQDMPFLSNNMDATRVGVTAFYRFPFLDDLQLLGTAMQVVQGRNVGKSFSWSLGVTKFFNFNPKKQ
ncbi:MAG: hypothetical protein KGS48_02185 [Bacteroidetes bacterium]|nr:hypothetical protein [Bacteroidota bacterium]